MNTKMNIFSWWAAEEESSLQRIICKSRVGLTVPEHTHREPLISTRLRWPVILCVLLERRREQKLARRLFSGSMETCAGGSRGVWLRGHRCHLEGSPLRTAGSLPRNLLLFYHCFKVFFWQVLLGSHQICSYSALFAMTFYLIGMQNEDLLLKHRFGRERIYCTNEERNSITWKNMSWKMT